jgi:S1-C subfamily serine protease
MGALEDIQRAVGEINEKVAAAVVGVGNGWRGGSGVVIAKGLVLTNAHNLRGEGVGVTFSDGREVQGQLAGVDVDGDIAVVKADTGNVKPITWDGASAPKLGQAVFAVSNPRGQGARVTFGLVSGVEREFRGPRGRRIRGSIEHTAPLSPGSSGGPIVNAAGQLQGINTNRLGDGFYLALPADDALRQRVDALGRGESPGRKRLGIAVAPGYVTRRMRRAVGLPEQDGLLIRGVEEGSTADKAGLREGDLIVEAGGKPTRDVDDLQEAVSAASGAIKLRVLRGTEERTVSVEPTVGEAD